MPGITGFISHSPAAFRPEQLAPMLDCLRHEPFYQSGSVLQPTLGLAVGWTAHPGTLTATNPFWNETADIGIIFSGEHFPDGGNTNGPALIRSYEQAGDRFFEQLNGIFSGVLIDRRAARVVVFNDRYGLGRICYHETKDGFYFASEAKSLLKVLPHLRQLDLASFGEFFSCGCALQNRTLFAGVSLLPGASAWTFSPGKPVFKAKYFQREEWENQPRITAEEYYGKLHDTFTRILPRYTRGELPVALSLTGGLDSRMILACTAALPQRLPCYTFGGPYRECADLKLARQLANACGQPHQAIPVTPGFFAEFPVLAQQTVYGTDGGMDVTGAVEMFVNRVARGIAPVRLTGNYGSEILRANVAFKPMPVSQTIYHYDFASHVRQAAATYAAERNLSAISFIAFKQVPWHHHARLAVEQSQLIPRSPYLDNELVAVAYQAPADLSMNKSLAHRFIEQKHPGLARIPTDRGVVGSRQANAGRLAVWRQEFLPKAEYSMDYGMPQWLAKIDRFMSAFHWERLFLGRQKFYHFRIWYRDQLAGYVKEMLLDRRTLGRPHLDGKRVEQVVLAHTSGRANHTLEIHKLLTSELIMRHLVEDVG